MEEPRQLADGVVRLGSSMVNWYLVGDDSGVTVVDTGLRGYRDELEPGLQLLGRSLDDVRAVILTHGDHDHTGVASKLAEERPDLPIHLHPEDEYLVHSGSKKTEDHMLGLLFRPSIYPLLVHFARNDGIKGPKIEQTVPLADGSTLDVPGQPNVIHVPGHTMGHVAFHFPSHSALFVGDTIVTWNPATGKRGPQLMRPGFNMSNKTALESMARYEGLGADLLLSGHGEPWTGGPEAAVAEARAGASDLATA
jgi:glyoxylase-like metal-dependent hydrolase (beta-lactamase superfamily II)